MQQEAIYGLKLGIENSMISEDWVKKSLSRILTMKVNCATCNWEHALYPPGLPLLFNLRPAHTMLSTRAYNESISVVRDRNDFLPLTSCIKPDDEILILTPLVNPLAASAASRAPSDSAAEDSPTPDHHRWDRAASVSRGEQVFAELGRSMARQRHGKVLHTCYTANGVRPVHENLISRASAVIILTADANRNLYQGGFTKHVSMICRLQGTRYAQEKPLIVVSVSSPDDFALDAGIISTYICTYDFTERALKSLGSVLYGEVSPTGQIPGLISGIQKLHGLRQHWLVEAFNETRDSGGLEHLVETLQNTSSAQEELTGVSWRSFLLRQQEVRESHFVVRNSSTHELYGFCATYFFQSTGTGVVGALLVHPSRQKLSIGASLHDRAMRTLLQQNGVKRCQIGCRLPSIYLGIPRDRGIETHWLRAWFANLGWGGGE